LRSLVMEAARGRGLNVRFGHDRPAAETGGIQDWTYSSDHGPFHDAGIPFLYFAVDDHPDYHKPTDTADRIPRQFYAAATELMLDAVRRLSDGEWVRQGH
jgi:Zn-dependent M28 family amino/carboxypeptidase